MFSKVLVANRGEIAVRVVRACKDAGIGSVAVYAEPDRDAHHVRIADEAYSLEGSTPGDSYLSIEKIVAVAQKAGADSVHPGYGFLAENADFAQAVIDAGLIWIGPPPAAIEALGDKAKAKHIADRANAPLAPGTKDPVESADEITKFAEEHGLPVAIKAVYGGGGRGLRKAEQAVDEKPRQRQNDLGRYRREQILRDQQQRQPQVTQGPDHVQNKLRYVAKHRASTKKDGRQNPAPSSTPTLLPRNGPKVSPPAQLDQGTGKVVDFQETSVYHPYGC